MNPRTRTDHAWVLDSSRLAVLEAIGDPEFVADLLEDFMRNFEVSLLELQQVLATREPKRIAWISHVTKTSAANVGALNLAELCKQLEINTISNSPDWARTQSLITDILNQSDDLRSSVARYQADGLAVLPQRV